MSSALLIRPSIEADIPAITAIYGHAVLHDTGTFELEAPSVDDMAQRLAAVKKRGWPWLVAVRGDKVIGYAYANDFRPRPAYRFSVENSVYIDPEARGQGIGRTLMVELLARCEARGARQVLAVIGDSANLGSVALHRSLGFRDAGCFEAVGWKFDRWLDVIFMQRSLGAGSLTPASQKP